MTARSTGPFASGPCDVLTCTQDRDATDALLRAMARLSDLDWTVTLAGTGADASLIASLGDRVRIVEPSDAAELERTWDRAGCYFHAGNPEPAMFEALQRGLPVALVSDAGAAVPPEACVLAAPGAVDDLSKALRRIVFDPALRARMSDAAIAFAQSL